MDEAGETARKPRGRPPGSKNKPKPPKVITTEIGNSMRPYVFEISRGCDVSETLSAFARGHQLGLCVLGGSGTVANVTLLKLAAPGSSVTYHGRFEIISLAGSFLPPPAPVKLTGLTIALAGLQPTQVLGGSVMGVLTAASPVLVVVACFLGATYERLPLTGEEDPHQVATTSFASLHLPTDHPCSMTPYNVGQSHLTSFQLTPDVLAWVTGNRLSF
ncbi:hypothetical protein O6H91_12G076400 [Diphasiastrum complanatum]|uniref:Uncharacterized protein n=1 Tax=Diphasiastrum complanatum TaxID=34168 RepID=A0ACC2C3U1_DIPCM|nr:hypothetical protein O6H91_12G076400 [Diphasiastrum complanatum]